MTRVKTVFLAVVFMFATACGYFENNTSVIGTDSNSERPSSALTESNEQPDVEQPESSAGSALERSDVKIQLLEGSYIYDVNNPQQAAYYHDYIFAAVILERGENFDPYWEPDYVEKYGSAPVYE